MSLPENTILLTPFGFLFHQCSFPLPSPFLYTTPLLFMLPKVFQLHFCSGVVNISPWKKERRKRRRKITIFTCYTTAQEARFKPPRATRRERRAYYFALVQCWNQCERKVLFRSITQVQFREEGKNSTSTTKLVLFASSSDSALHHFKVWENCAEILRSK